MPSITDGPDPDHLESADLRGRLHPGRELGPRQPWGKKWDMIGNMLEKIDLPGVGGFAGRKTSKTRRMGQKILIAWLQGKLAGVWSDHVARDPEVRRRRTVAAQMIVNEMMRAAYILAGQVAWRQNKLRGIGGSRKVASRVRV